MIESCIDESYATALARSARGSCVSAQMDLAPYLRELDGEIEEIELGLRDLIRRIIGDNPSLIPSAVLSNANDRISKAVRKNAALDADHYATVPAKLEFFDLRELQAVIDTGTAWPRFESIFGSRTTFGGKFSQLAELRNSIRHSRSVRDCTEGRRGRHPLVQAGLEKMIIRITQLSGNRPAVQLATEAIKQSMGMK